ncbi:hypothetical protein NDU88_005604 [Pleurodeles waltl]|uniref:Uncharacterized protein n=1 Tax=Pleurodeles waltl TaxID=8319 RepID=A0AAV7SM32_PLEWA|nr:hypothetical protein NDU88_005604 [Pleurodeles waltl]
MCRITSYPRNTSNVTAPQSAGLSVCCPRAVNLRRQISKGEPGGHSHQAENFTVALLDRRPASRTTLPAGLHSNGPLPGQAQHSDSTALQHRASARPQAASLLAAAAAPGHTAMRHLTPADARAVTATTFLAAPPHLRRIPPHPNLHPEEEPPGWVCSQARRHTGPPSLSTGYHGHRQSP